jgi:hypothetical protein
MMRTMLWIVACFSALVSSVPTQACQPAGKPAFWRDKPIKIFSDGSFEEAGDFYSSFLYTSVSGNAPLDIGGGKFEQKIKYSLAWSTREAVLVVDCSSLETILIKGAFDPEAASYGGGPPLTTRMLYPPHGKIRLTETVTIAQLAATSESEGYQYVTDARKPLFLEKKQNAYNPFTGCKVLYPDSPGATQ